jgi:hypothetical protein
VPTPSPESPFGPLTVTDTEDRPRRLASAGDSGPVLDTFLGICTAVGVIAGLIGLAVGSNGLKAIGGAAIFGFFALGLAVFSTGCLFAPSKTLSHPGLAGVIGTSNPTKARIACAIAAVLFWPMGLLAVIAPFMDQK